ncbi:hypothetical protein [Acinetobacter sp.]|uniref:hypothetical protein n=1 Tax=Acinetobacter sp. TaxID=472 RepID=UPI0035AE3C75
MNNMTKIALVGASILSAGALTACQSTAAPKDADHGQMMKQHHGDQERKMTPEQREQMKQMRAERHAMMKQMQQACDGKAVGTAMQVKAGDKTIDGTCLMTFKADHKARGEHKPMRGEHRPMHAGMHGQMQRGEPLTDAKRAELTKQFDQRLAERQAKQQAIAKACQGKTDGTAVAFKVGEQQINGKCAVRFQPNVVAPAAAK